MPNQLIELLRSDLLRGGVSPRYVRRYCAELSDHYRLAVEENQSAGLTPEEATVDACRQLGDQETLFQSVVEHASVLTFARRYSAITFSVLPIPALLATKTLLAFVGMLVGLVASQWSFLSIAWIDVFRPVLRLGLDYGTPLVVALLFGLLAHRRGCRPSWPVLSALLIGFVANGVQFELRRTMLDLGFAQAGVGAVSLAVTPLVFLPLLSCVLLLAIQRRSAAKSTA